MPTLVMRRKRKSRPGALSTEVLGNNNQFLTNYFGQQSCTAIAERSVCSLPNLKEICQNCGLYSADE